MRHAVLAQERHEGGDGGGEAPGPCFTTIKNKHTSVHKFYYRTGGCMAIVLSTWEEWTCCPVTADGTHYGCGMELQIGGGITGC